MEYALLKLEDLKLEMSELGLVSAVAMVPEFFELDIRESKIRADYIYETIKNLEKDELSETSKTLKMLEAINDIKIKKSIVLANKGIPSKIMVIKISEKDGITEVCEYFTKRTMYTASNNFNREKVSEYEKNAYLSQINIDNMNEITGVFQSKHKKFI